MQRVSKHEAHQDELRRQLSNGSHRSFRGALRAQTGIRGFLIR